MSATSDRPATATPGQAAYVVVASSDDSLWDPWPALTDEGRAIWEAAAQAGVEADAAPVRLASQAALPLGEMAYCGFTAAQGPHRICWEALEPDERKQWHQAAVAVHDRYRAQLAALEMARKTDLSQIEYFRELVAEILALCPSCGFWHAPGSERAGEWRERAGLEN